MLGSLSPMNGSLLPVWSWYTISLAIAPATNSITFQNVKQLHPHLGILDIVASQDSAMLGLSCELISSQKKCNNIFRQR